MKTTLIKFTELVKKGDDFIEQPCLINSEGIVAVFDTDITPGGIPIVKAEGTDFGRKVRAVTLTNGRTTHITETIDEILAKVHDSATL